MKFKLRLQMILLMLLITIISFGLGWGYGNIAGWMEGYNSAASGVAFDIKNSIKYGDHFWLGNLEFRSLKNQTSAYVYLHDTPKKEVAKNGNN